MSKHRDIGTDIPEAYDGSTGPDGATPEEDTIGPVTTPSRLVSVARTVVLSGYSLAAIGAVTVLGNGTWPTITNP